MPPNSSQAFQHLVSEPILNLKSPLRLNVSITLQKSTIEVRIAFAKVIHLTILRSVTKEERPWRHNLNDKSGVAASLNISAFQRPFMLPYNDQFTGCRHAPKKRDKLDIRNISRILSKISGGKIEATRKQLTCHPSYAGKHIRI